MWVAWVGGSHNPDPFLSCTNPCHSRRGSGRRRPPSRLWFLREQPTTSSRRFSSRLVWIDDGQGFGVHACGWTVVSPSVAFPVTVYGQGGGQGKLGFPNCDFLLGPTFENLIFYKGIFCNYSGPVRNFDKILGSIYKY